MRTGRVLLVTVFALLAFGGESRATTVELGQIAPSDEVGPPFQCGGSCGGFQLISSSGSPTYEVPAGNWVVISWSTRLGTGDAGLRGLYAVSGSQGNWTMRAKGGLVAIPTPPAVMTVASSIPVDAGWRVGVDTEGEGTFVFDGAAGDRITGANSFDLDLGEQFPGADFPGEDLRVNLSATLESDADDDGVPDSADPCPLPDSCAPPGPPDGDGDGDGVGDAIDNCAAAPNPDQRDFDRDGLGDACDPPKEGRCANSFGPPDGGGRLEGSAFGDVLIGTGARDRLFGLDGDDCLKGKGDADRIKGGTGKDALGGGPGDDRINAEDGERDRVRCGGGVDRVRADSRDRTTGCERVKTG
jgi:hypothetical protein